MSVTNPAATKYSIVHIGQDNPEQDWRELIRLCGNHLSEHVLKQMMRLLEGKCQTIVVEPDYICKDYLDTFSHHHSKRFATYPAKTTRLLFFEGNPDPRDWWELSTYGHFIGYSVIRPDRISCLGRTVLDPDYCNLGSNNQNMYVCKTTFEANLLGESLLVDGFPHMSQEADVNVCAHAACWMCFRYFSQRYPVYREMRPYEITQMTSNLSEGRLVPSPGLTARQICEIFSRFGFFPVKYDRKDTDSIGRKQNDDGRFDRLMYTYLESGLPIVISLEKAKDVEGHAVIAIGHVSDYKRRIKKTSRTMFSSQYVTGLVVNDDNTMPYQILPAANIPDRENVSSYQMPDISAFVVPLPEEVFLTAEDVERLTQALLADPTFGIEKHLGVPLRNIVVRTYLTTGRAFKMHWREHKEKLAKYMVHSYTTLPMPKFIWVSELSTVKEYTNNCIIGEIILDATGASNDNWSWLAIHYLGNLFLNDRDIISGQRGSLKSDTKEDAYPLYRHNLHPTNGLSGKRSV